MQQIRSIVAGFPSTQHIQTTIAHDAHEPGPERSLACIVAFRRTQDGLERILNGIRCIISVTENLSSQCMRATAELCQFLLHIVCFC